MTNAVIQNVKISAGIIDNLIYLFLLLVKYYSTAIVPVETFWGRCAVPTCQNELERFPEFNEWL
jgi:hypothetical protein